MRALALFLLRLIPLRNIIVFESHPAFACNTYAVYKHMKQQGLFSRYKPVWLLQPHELETCRQTSDALCLPRYGGGVFTRLHVQYIRASARCLISCNDALSKRQPKQLSVFLGHGSKIKKTRGTYEIGDGVDFALYQSEFFYNVTSYEYNIPKDRLICLGYPRCDAFFSHTDALRKLFPDISNEKVIAWLPTWRQHKLKGGISSPTETGIPLISSADEIVSLNDSLRDAGVHVFLKPHPAQNLQFLNAASLDYFHIINDELLAEAGVQLNEFLAETDALITDYSSVIFDYLLLDHPIGLTLDDYELYAKEKGFAYDVAEIFQVGAHLLDMDALLSFIGDVAAQRDDKQSQRDEIRNLTNYYQDANSSERVVNFIKNELGKRA